MVEILKFLQLANALCLLYLGIKGLVALEYELPEWHAWAVSGHSVICILFLIILKRYH